MGIAHSQSRVPEHAWTSGYSRFAWTYEPMINNPDRDVPPSFSPVSDRAPATAWIPGLRVRSQPTGPWTKPSNGPIPGLHQQTSWGHSFVLKISSKHVLMSSKPVLKMSFQYTAHPDMDEDGSCVMIRGKFKRVNYPGPR